MTDDELRQSPAYVLFFELARRERLAVVTAVEGGLDSVRLRELALEDYAVGRRSPFPGASEPETVTRIAAAILATLTDGHGGGELPIDVCVSSCLEAAVRLVKSADDDFTAIDALDALLQKLTLSKQFALARLTRN